jgi:hypothetical protein
MFNRALICIVMLSASVFTGCYSSSFEVNDPAVENSSMLNYITADSDITVVNPPVKDSGDVDAQINKILEQRALAKLPARLAVVLYGVGEVQCAEKWWGPLAWLDSEAVSQRASDKATDAIALEMRSLLDSFSGNDKTLSAQKEEPDAGTNN